MAYRLGGATVINAMAAVGGYALTVLLARQGGPEEFGQYTLCVAWAALITTLVDGGSDTAFTRVVTRSAGDIQSAFNTVLTVRCSILLAACVVILAGGMFAPSHAPPAQTAMMLFSAFNFGMVFEYHGRTVTYAALVCGERLLMLAANYVLLAWLPFGEVVYWVYAAGSLLSLGIQAAFWRRLVRAWCPAPFSAVKAYLGEYWPLLAVVLAQLSYGNLSRLVLEAKFGVATFAAVSVAFQFIGLGSVFQSQVDRVFRPRMVRAVHSGERQELRLAIRDYLAMAVVPMAALALATFLLANVLIDVAFGDSYGAAGRALQCIAPLFVSVCLLRLADLLLLAAGKLVQNMIIGVGAAGIMLSVLAALPATTAVSTFLLVVVATQLLQAGVAGAFAFRALHKR